MSQPITAVQQAEIIAFSDHQLALTQRSLENIVSLRRSLAAAGASDQSHVLEVFEFILLWQFDVYCLQQDLVRATGTSRASVYARSLVLSIHESTHTLRGLLSQRFNDVVSRHLGADKWQPLVRRAHSDACRLFKTSEAHFGHARDKWLAHRSANADDRIAFIASMNERAAAELSIGALAILSSLAPVVAAYTGWLWDQLRRAT